MTLILIATTTTWMKDHTLMIVIRLKEQEERRKTDAKRDNVNTIRALGGRDNPFSHGINESGWGDHGRSCSRSRGSHNWSRKENRCHSRSPSMGEDR